jgi:hypothetical protein
MVREVFLQVQTEMEVTHLVVLVSTQVVLLVAPELVVETLIC